MSLDADDGDPGAREVEDRAAILRLHDEWIGRERRGEAVDDLCDAHVVFLPPVGAPVVGRDRVRAWLSAHDAPVVAIQIRDRTVQLNDAVAALSARFRTALHPGDGDPRKEKEKEREPSDAGGGRPTIVEGRHRWVLRRDDAGTWRVAAVVWEIDAD